MSLRILNEVDMPSKKGTYRLWLFYSIFVLFLIVTVSIGLGYDYQRRISNAQHESSMIAISGKTLVDQMMEKIEVLFPGINDLIIHSEHHDEDELEILNPYLSSRRDEMAYLMDLLVVNSNGQISSWSGKGKPPDIQDREYIRHHIDATGPTDLYVGQPLLSKVHQGKWFFAVSRAYFRESGALSHILVAIIDIDYIYAALEKLENHTDGTRVLGSISGYIYSRIPEHNKMVGRKVEELVQLSKLEGKKNTFFSTSPLDGLDRIVTLAHTDTRRLVFIASLSMDQIMKGWFLTLYLVLPVLMITILVITLMTFRLHRNYEELIHLSTRDGLSGLFNRRTFIAIAEKECSSVDRYAGKVSVIMFDLDNFKQVNDNHGHSMGDQAIEKVGNIMRELLRASDIGCRYGGEEFLILLPQTGLDGAKNLAEKIRAEIARQSCSETDRCCSISASFGVAEAHRKEKIESLLIRVDKALYQAKELGKNQVITIQ